MFVQFVSDKLQNIFMWRASRALLPKLRLMYQNEKMAFMQKRMTNCNGMYGIGVDILNATLI
jgi:hypothetical protein